MQPDRTLATAPLAGTKKSKERITVAFCANATGSDCLKPVVIGQRKSPRCFKNFDPQSLVHYYHSPKGWMNTPIYHDWLLKLNRKMALQNRRIALIVDNHASHRTPPNLTHVKIVKLPPNMTSKIQPLDSGIIAAFKRHYQRFHVIELLRQVDGNPSKKPTIELKDALYFVNLAWKQVSAETVKNCWRHSGIYPVEAEQDLEIVDQDSSVDEQEEIDSIIRLLPGLGEAMSADEFVAMGENEQIGAELSDEEIVAIVTGKVNEDEEDEEDEEDDMEPQQQQPATSRKDARCGIEVAMSYFEAHADIFGSFLPPLKKMLCEIDDHGLKIAKQTSIEDYV